MAKLKILKEGDPTLRRKSRPVTEITPRILTLLDDMVETMRDANGCGLAAPQVGVLRRVVVIETPE
ncbi:MAG TPA: peptide deformylase, partial [Bacillota bacterium]|nr:peptide deformylase [Bacillota bacterium]